MSFNCLCSALAWVLQTDSHTVPYPFAGTIALVYMWFIYKIYFYSHEADFIVFIEKACAVV